MRVTASLKLYSLRHIQYVRQQCKRNFPSERALSGHKGRVHSRRQPQRTIAVKNCSQSRLHWRQYRPQNLAAIPDEGPLSDEEEIIVPQTNNSQNPSSTQTNQVHSQMK